MKRWIIAILLAFTVLAQMGCLGFSTRQCHRYPAEMFARKRAEISRLQARSVGHPGFHRVHGMVYSGEDHELITFNVPRWVMRWAMKNEDKRRDRRAVEYGRKYMDLEIEDLLASGRMRPGLLLEVQDESEDTHILLWLE